MKKEAREGGEETGVGKGSRKKGREGVRKGKGNKEIRYP